MALMKPLEMTEVCPAAPRPAHSAMAAVSYHVCCSAYSASSKGKRWCSQDKNQVGIVNRPYLISTLGEVPGEFAARIASLPEDMAAREFVMQRMKDSALRQLWRLASALESLRPGALTHTNKKNAGRSEEVVENTRPHDIMPAKKSAFVCESYGNLRKLHDFFAVSHDIFACLRPKNTVEPASANLPFTHSASPLQQRKQHRQSADNGG